MRCDIVLFVLCVAAKRGAEAFSLKLRLSGMPLFSADFQDSASHRIECLCISLDVCDEKIVVQI
jgi:hypothetical protein